MASGQIVTFIEKGDNATFIGPIPQGGPLVAPVPVGTLPVDLTPIANPDVNIDFSCTINFLPLPPGAPWMLWLEFQLVKVLANGTTTPPLAIRNYRVDEVNNAGFPNDLEIVPLYFSFLDTNVIDDVFDYVILVVPRHVQAISSVAVNGEIIKAVSQDLE